MDTKELDLINTKTIDYPQIGKITYKRNIRARRLAISIRSKTGVRVTIPGVLSFRSAESFVLSKSKWIIEKIEYFKEGAILFNSNTQFRTKKHSLRFVPSQTDRIKVVVKDPYINIIHPDNVDVSADLVQKAIVKGIELAYRIEAKELLPYRIEHLAKVHGFVYNKLSIKRATSRWGSCSAKNNINLSIFLMKLPDHLIDFIILHELCHTVHKNHGIRFWEKLNNITQGNAKALAKEIKNYRSGI